MDDFGAGLSTDLLLSSPIVAMSLPAISEVCAFVGLTAAQSDAVMSGSRVRGTWRSRWGLRPTAVLATWPKLFRLRDLSLCINVYAW